MVKALIVIVCIAVGLFLLSLIVYFFNLDMKMAAKLTPILEKHYDRIKRDKRF